ncbi:YitT family protein [Bacteroidota bacterium]
MAKKKSVKQGKPKPNSDNGEVRKIEITLAYFIKDSLIIILGILSAGFGLKGFLLPNAFIDGGVMGISLLVSIKTAIPLALLVVIINIPFLLFGFTQVSKWFVFKSFFAIAGLALALLFIEYPVITTDKLLVAVFGGFFLGAGIGLAIRGGSVIDGTEILAIYLSKKIGFSIGDFITFINIIIFSTAAFLLSIEQALYAILTYLAASKTADFVIEGVDEFTGVNIISEFSDEIRQMITNELGRGVTVFTGKRGYTKEGEVPEPIDIIHTVITRLEISRLKKEVAKIDPKAFLTMMTINDTKGGMIKKKSMK